MAQTPSREERLAAKLRENLHRRKAQARALTVNGNSGESPRSDPPAQNESAALSKPRPES